MCSSLMNMKLSIADVVYRCVYTAYAGKLWYCELIDMAHKLILTSLIAFLPLNMQVRPQCIL